LRERKEDIIHLSDRFVKATNTELNKEVQGFSDSALHMLLEHDWPGNVRQLRAAVRRAVLQADDIIRPEHLVLKGVKPANNKEIPKVGVSEWEGLSLKEILRRNTVELETRVLKWAIQKAGGNKAEAARLLHIDYKTIHSKAKQYGIVFHAEEHDEKE
jgi:two-component system nitrogen regulation response regulator GlnG